MSYGPSVAIIGQLQVSILFYHMGPQEQTWVLRLGGQSLYPLDLLIPLNVKPTQGKRCQIIEHFITVDEDAILLFC